MTKPAQIILIMAELRRLHPDAPALELLQLAFHVLRAHRSPGGFDPGDDPLPAMGGFFAAEVDEAMGRGDGWKVVEYERQGGMSFEDDGYDDRPISPRLKRLLR